ncbi:MAG: hypothetical protein ABIV43_04080 [Candidatus Saccharimonadales bacterium]
MSLLENDSMSTLRAVRRVSPSRSLANFLANATLLAKEYEPSDGFIDPLVYSVDSLRVTLLERRTQASDKANELIHRFYTRMVSDDYKTSRTVKRPSGKKVKVDEVRQNPLPLALRWVESLYYEKQQPMLARANEIGLSVQPYPRVYGSEFSLLIDSQEGHVADVLLAQEEMLHQVSINTAAGKKLPRNKFYPGRALHIPFMRLPIAADNETMQKEFTELLSTDLPVHNLDIGPIVWKIGTVSERGD